MTPIPVSVTVIVTTSEPDRDARITTAPPSPVNLTAFVSRLITTCFNRSSSASTVPTSSSASTTMSIAL